MNHKDHAYKFEYFMDFGIISLRFLESAESAANTHRWGTIAILNKSHRNEFKLQALLLPVQFHMQTIG